MQTVPKFMTVALVAAIFAIPLVLHGFAQREVSDELHTNRFGTFNIKYFGAVADGTTLNTKAINTAVRACAHTGGGTILIPVGTFLSGPIELLPNVHLYLDAGAVLKGSKNPADYESEAGRLPLIYADRADNISITGKGAIDGSGMSFMNAEKLHIPADFRRELTRQGDRYLSPSDDIADGPVSPLERPERLLRFSECTTIVIRDVLFADSPAWTIHLADCDNALIDGVTIRNNLLVPNSDGIHCTTSRNVRIANCNIEAGDDAICVTGFGDIPGVSENVAVTNCTILSRSSGIRVGYGDNDIRNCTFQNLVIHNSNRGLGIFVRDKGSVSNIRFSDIVIGTRLHTGHWWGHGEPIHISALPRTENTALGSISDVHFSNITAHSENGAVIFGSAEEKIRNVSLTGVQITLEGGPLASTYGGNYDFRPAVSPELSIMKHDVPAVFAQNTDGLKLDNVSIHWQDALPPAYFTSGVYCSGFRDLTINGLECRQAGKYGPAVLLENGTGVSIRNSKAEPGTDVFLRQSGVSHARLFEGNDLSDARMAMEPAESGFIASSGNAMPGR